MNRTKRFCAIALAAMMAVTSLAGCGGTSGGDTGTASTGGSTTGGEVSTAVTDNGAVNPFGDEGADGPINLKVWGPDTAQGVLKEQCSKFAEDMKGYAEVNIEVVPQGEADSAALVLNDASAAADVFGFACDNLNKLQRSGNLLKVTTANKEKIIAENSEGSVSAATIDGDLYGYPETGDNSYILVYNKDVVSDEAAKTLEGTLAACKEQNKQFVMDAGNGYYACLFLFTAGAKIDGYEDDGETQKFTEYDEATAVKTMLAFHNLFTEYKDIFVSGDTSKVVDGFKSGTVGAGIDGSWNFAGAKSALGEKAGFAVLPTINVDGTDTQIVNMFGYKLLGVNSSSKYPNASAALAMYLTSEECQLQRAEKLNWGPSNKNAAESDLVKNDQALSAILAQSENSVAQVNVADTFWTPLAQFGNKIIDFNDPMTEESAKTLFNQTIANVRDE